MKHTYYIVVFLLSIVALAVGFLLGFTLDPVQEPAAAAAVVEVVELPALPVDEPVKTYTDEDLEVLALIIYQEAGSDSCSDETRLMVGNVVLNRVASPRYPDTIKEVALQRSQYGRLHWTGLVWPARASKEVEAHAVQRAYDCAEELLNGIRVLPEDVIFQSEFVQGTEVVAYQDGTYFCR